MYDRICQGCGIAFKAKGSRAMYHSSRCKRAVMIARLPEQTCVCGVTFKPTREKQTYCSPRCSSTHGVVFRKVVCRHCGSSFIHRGRGRVSSCETCRSIDQRTRVRKHKGLARVGSGGAQWGANNHSYLTGDTDPSYVTKCFRFWPRRCAACAAVSRIEVHHIDRDPSNNDPVNLVPLCIDCHTVVHAKIKNDVACSTAVRQVVKGFDEYAKVVRKLKSIDSRSKTQE
jgi:hypothetical protein